ncbi:hypothetical protein F9K87_00545 [Brucella anthropi]|uniref:hypothetical protein n=1 Tax=Brucella anthropi TaxID=529 RepID=UPI00124F6E54|nr:hypothetical protein [Brucella anthropi]KAB2800002.1 hypothetical protein F9K87_00545 [Brucella anthropi]
MRTIAFVSFIGLGFMTNAAAAQSPHAFSYEGWVGQKWQADPDQGCIMRKQAGKDLHFVIYANGNEAFSIGVYSKFWKLLRGEKLTGRISFDGGDPMPLTGGTEDPQTILFGGGGEEEGLEPFLRAGHQLSLAFGRSKLSVSLKGSSKAIDMLYDCVEGRGTAVAVDVEPPIATHVAQSSPTGLPIQSGYYALTGGSCSEGFGSNTIYTDGKTLSWPSSGCRFERIEQLGQTTYRVKQTCGRNDDDIETKEATYTVSSQTSFSLKSGDWETEGLYCEPNTLPIADRERVTPPIYARSNLAESLTQKEPYDDALTTYERRVAEHRRRGEELREREKAEREAADRQASQESRQMAAQSQNPANQVPSGKPIALSSTDENAVKELIGLRLRDEASARFRNFAAAELPDGTYVVCGFVNGKNQFGAYTGYTLFYSNYRPDTKNFTYFVMANNENIATLCRLNGVVFQ